MPAFIDRGTGNDQPLNTARWARAEDIAATGATWQDLMAYPETVPGLLLGEYPVDRSTSSCSIAAAGGQAAEYQYRLGDHAALFWQDDRHVVTIAGNRSGKGVSCIVPNVALYAGSVLVNDPKGEVATLTAERRGQGSDLIQGLGQRVAVLDPYRSAQVPEAYRSGFNPLDALGPHNPYTIADTGMLADAFTNDTADSDGSSLHFKERARSWIEGLILHCISTEPPERRNLITVYEYLTTGIKREGQVAGTGTAPPPQLVLRQLMRENKAYNGLVEAAERMLSQLGDNERGSVLSTAERMLSFLKYEGPHEMFAKSMSFPLEALKNDPQGCTIYLCLPVTELSTHAGIVRMLIQQTIKMMERTPGPPAAGHQVLFMLDEFATLRHLRVLEDAAPYMAGFGVKLWAIVQDIGQLRSLYKERWETFLGNAGVVTAFANADNGTREYLSQLLGRAEVRRATQSTSAGDSLNDSGSVRMPFPTKRRPGSGAAPSGDPGNQGWSEGTSTGNSTSEQIQSGALLTPDEISRMFNRDSGRMLVLINGELPLVLHRVRYFDRFEFMGKVGADPTHPRPLAPWRTARRYRNDAYQAMRNEELAQAQALAAHAERARRRAAWRGRIAVASMLATALLALLAASLLADGIASVGGAALLLLAAAICWVLWRQRRQARALARAQMAQAASAQQQAADLRQDLDGFAAERQWLDQQAAAA